MNTATTQITLNGETRQVAKSTTLADVLAELGWKPTQVVVEHNGQVVPRTCLADVQLNEGDQVEIILPVAGG
ncbi:MAG: sulfur carrier protein ThiS [Verrucomicrobiae bacterium]|nr:sulfur carrier protein ThiS [Verrucomicrobiae bacterium]